MQLLVSFRSQHPFLHLYSNFIFPLKPTGSAVRRDVFVGEDSGVPWI